MAPLIPFILPATLSAIATVATRPKAKDVPPPTKPEGPALEQGAVEAQRMAEMRRQQQGKRGRASTIMSGSPLGQPGPANTAKKYLTGQ